MHITDAHLKGQTTGYTRHTSGQRLHKPPSCIFVPAEKSIWLTAHFLFAVLVSLSDFRGGCSQHNLLCSGGRNGGDNWEVFWQRLLPGSPRPFSSRRCPRGQGLWDLWETDIKAVKQLSGKRGFDSRKEVKFQFLTWRVFKIIWWSFWRHFYRHFLKGHELTCFLMEGQMNHVYEYLKNALSLFCALVWVSGHLIIKTNFHISSLSRCHSWKLWICVRLCKSCDFHSGKWTSEMREMLTPCGRLQADMLLQKWQRKLQ